MIRFKINVQANRMEGTEKTILFDTSEGVLEITSKKFIVGEKYGTLPVPTRTGYKFTGWYDENDEKITEDSNVSALIEKLTAKWEKNKSNPSAPVLTNDLIPVTISENLMTVTKADINGEWYDYDNQIWANAVILLDKSKTYAVGDIIPLSNIESYFVWIPRYKYKIFNEGNYNGITSLNTNAVQTIEIEFESMDTPISNGNTKDSWLTHPAFTNFNTNGIWVGKYESGYKGATTAAEAEVNSDDYTKLQIKLGVYSWRNIAIGNAFKVSYDYNRNLDSHMMKNTEWGAVAYLSHSQYGKQNEAGENTEIYDTNMCSEKYITYCDDVGSSNSSTTGNSSGIFDMTGRGWEYVMGYNINASTIGGDSGITTHYSDFFTNDAWNKYYDKYTSDSDIAYTNRILGDATGEMGPFEKYGNYSISSWYRDSANFVSHSNPWFTRGGVSELFRLSGIFAYDNYFTGNGSTSCSFRVVLAPQ